jgi:hypothetical protein
MGVRIAQARDNGLDILALADPARRALMRSRRDLRASSNAFMPLCRVMLIVGSARVPPWFHRAGRPLSIINFPYPQEGRERVSSLVLPPDGATDGRDFWNSLFAMVTRLRSRFVSSGRSHTSA